RLLRRETGTFRRAARSELGRPRRSPCRRELRAARAPVLASALHSLFIGHDRGAQVHRARRRRNASAASEGTPAPLRHQTGRRRLLLHDVRLDDVALARVGARGGRDAPSLRRLAASSRAERVVAARGTRIGRGVRHEREVPAGAREKRCGSRARNAPRRAARRALDGLAAAAVELRLRVSCNQERRAARVDLGRDRYHLLLRSRQSDMAGLPRRAAVSRSRDGRQGVRRNRPRGPRAEGRARMRDALPLDAARFLERSGSGQVPRRVLRALPRRLVSWRLRGAHAPRRHDHLRTLGRGAEPRRRADRHGRDLPCRRADRRHRGMRRGRPALRWRHADRALRPPEAGATARRAAFGRDPRTAPPRREPAARPREDPRGHRHPAHAERQDRRARRPRCRAWYRGQEPRRAREPRVARGVSRPARAPRLMGPLAEYRRRVAAGELSPDDAQGVAVDAFERLHRELVAAGPPPRGWRRRVARGLKRPIEPVRGVYLWGGVGRGKTLMMDLFYKSLPFDDKLRLHFHRFMAEVHAGLKKLRDREDPLEVVADDLADRTRILCFDELAVNDIADAMILANLFSALFARGVTLAATSNLEPGELYRDGLQRQRFVPTIDLIRTYTDVVHVEGCHDYRLQFLEKANVYLYPAGDAATRELERFFETVAPDGPATPGRIEILNR